MQFALFKKVLKLIRQNSSNGAEQQGVVYNVVDSGAETILPDGRGWKVTFRRKSKTMERRGNLVYVDGRRVKLIRVRDGMRGKRLRRKLNKKEVLDATVLDSLRANEEVVPNEWRRRDRKRRSRYILFLGTTYHFANGRDGVRYLYDQNGGLHSGFLWLGGEWDQIQNGYVAVLV